MKRSSSKGPKTPIRRRSKTPTRQSQQKASNKKSKSGDRASKGAPGADNTWYYVTDWSAVFVLLALVPFYMATSPNFYATDDIQVHDAAQGQKIKSSQWLLIDSEKEGQAPWRVYGTYWLGHFFAAAMLSAGFAIWHTSEFMEHRSITYLMFIVGPAAILQHDGVTRQQRLNMSNQIHAITPGMPCPFKEGETYGNTMMNFRGVLFCMIAHSVLIYCLHRWLKRTQFAIGPKASSAVVTSRALAWTCIGVVTMINLPRIVTLFTSGFDISHEWERQLMGAKETTWQIAERQGTPSSSSCPVAWLLLLGKVPE
jgi:hypothetical protein